MSEKAILKIGVRGEIYTTQRVRSKVGLTPGGRAFAIVEGGKLILQPKPTALSLLDKPKVNLKPLSAEELSNLRREIAEEVESR
ncbi:MAG: hypothetical protein QXN62_05170 [Candidatus Bathyarchaeia archaeon]